MKSKELFAIILSMFFIFNITLLSQSHTVSLTPQIEKSIEQEAYGAIALYSEITKHDYGKAITTINGVYHYHTYRTGYKFNLSGIPSNATNLSAYLEAYRTSGSGNSQIVLVSNNLDFNTNKDVYIQVGSGSYLFTTNTSSGQLHNVSSYVGFAENRTRLINKGEARK